MNVALPREHWQNWSGYVSARPLSLRQPTELEQLGDLIKSSPGPVRFVGTGHSFTPLVQSQGTILSLDHFDALVSHDPAALQSRIGAGIEIGALTRKLHRIGQALPNMGDIDKQTFGGALATSTHGSGIGLGAYPTQLRAMQIVDGRGVVREFNSGDHFDEMAAMGASLGVFGGVTEVTIQNILPYRLHRHRWAQCIKEVLDQFESMMTAHRSSEFYYIPFSGQAIFLSSDITDAPISTRPPQKDDDGVVTLRRLRTFLLRFPWLRARLIGSAISRLAGEDYVGEWLDVYASERNVKFNEMEYHVPFEEGAATVRKIISLLENDFPHVYFPLEVRVVAPDEIWLSPFYQRASCSIAIHHDAAEDPQPFFRAAEKIFLAHGGRPHWGKMHNLKAKELSTLYPRWADAMAVRRDMDPDNRFVTPYIAGLLGMEL
ncbi:D-arabinono-1,4-lactone oxidase [Phyllobacterium endophyticum]|uniref:Oxidoreductase n=1 Tax=Phyllobacterium endophyticum TaxID=1149773 RepID=A0A2P7AKU6_9HYPH|nr:D-arabinono-1,4-lactone oxidase [Phyllobacterium endophyticum]MBB3233276.1 FAD-linked oxidoreductase [Phyllobacterium endophyticum]PSH54838.1 oxidoreductase [Phyllobacterium endophyticum]TYR43292.1 FAD-binding protein [Phyllobacterium endophyticum]